MSYHTSRPQESRLNGHFASSGVPQSAPQNMHNHNNNGNSFNSAIGERRGFSSSLEFETDMNLLMKYGYTSPTNPMTNPILNKTKQSNRLTNSTGDVGVGGGSAGMNLARSWDVFPDSEADIVNFVTNLPNSIPIRYNENENSDITDEYNVCSIINSEHNYYDAQLQHEFDEDLLNDEKNSENGSSRILSLSALNLNSEPISQPAPTPSVSLPPVAISVSVPASSPSEPVVVTKQPSAPPPSNLVKSQENISESESNDDEDKKNKKKRANSKGHQPKVRMSLAEFLSGDEVPVEDNEAEEEECSNVLWVGNIGPDVKEEELREDFGMFGPIHDIKILRDSFCAFINFQEVSHAVNAKRELNGEIFGTQYIVIKYRKSNQKYNPHTAADTSNSAANANPLAPSNSTPNNPPNISKLPDTTGNRIVTNPACSSLWVGNLSDDVTKAELYEEFSKFGPIESIRMLSHCAFINFTTIEHATSALTAMQGKLLGQMNIKINYGRSRQPIVSSSFEDEDTKKEEAIPTVVPSSSPQNQLNRTTNSPSPRHLLSAPVNNSAPQPSVLSTSPVNIASRSPPLLSQSPQPKHDVQTTYHPYSKPQQAPQPIQPATSPNFMYFKQNSAPQHYDEDILIQQQMQQHLHLQQQQSIPSASQSLHQKPPPKQQYTLFNSNQAPYAFNGAPSQPTQIPMPAQGPSQQSYPPSNYGAQQLSSHMQFQQQQQQQQQQQRAQAFQQQQQPNHQLAQYQRMAQQQQQQFQRPFPGPQLFPQRPLINGQPVDQLLPGYTGVTNLAPPTMNDIVDYCHLCGMAVADTVIIPCSHWVCNKCARARISKDRKCPFCNQFVTKLSSPYGLSASLSPTAASLQYE